MEREVLGAIAKGDLAELKRLDKIWELKSISNLGCYAWESPNVEVIDFLVDQRKMYSSELQLAAVRGDVAAVRLVLKRLKERDYPPGSDFARRNVLTEESLIRSYSPLRLAIRRGHTEVVRLLIAGGANVNEVVIDSLRWQPNAFPLGEAVRLGRKEIVQLLLEGGARVHGNDRDRDPNGSCPLMIAIYEGWTEILAILLKAGANPNVLVPATKTLPYGFETAEFSLFDRRALHIAVVEGNPEMVRLLLKKGALVNAPSSDGVTPLTVAILHRQDNVADILRAAGGQER